MTTGHPLRCRSLCTIRVVVTAASLRASWLQLPSWSRLRGCLAAATETAGDAAAAAVAAGSGDLKGPALAAVRGACAQMLLPILECGLVELVTQPQLVQKLLNDFVLRLYLRVLLSLAGVTRALAGVVDLYLLAGESKEDVPVGGISADAAGPGPSSSGGVGGGSPASVLWKHCEEALGAATSLAELLAMATAKMSAKIEAGATDGSGDGDVAARSLCLGVDANESAAWAEQMAWASRQTQELAAAAHGAALKFCAACDRDLFLLSAST